MSKTDQERRSYPRTDARVPAQVELQSDTGATTVRTLNVSGSGLYCWVPEYISPMTKLDIAMILPIRKEDGLKNELMEFEGVVVRTEPEEEQEDRDNYYLAIYFSGLPEEGRKLVHRYVQQHGGR
jgi:hypothetical protein